MKEIAVNLKAFFGGFDLPAYVRENIPDEVELPYITYDLKEPRWDMPVNMSCQVYYPKNQLEDLLTKSDQILAEIGEGLKITMPGGYLLLYLDTRDRMSDEYSESVYISLVMNAYHLPGQ